jgi:hypothetical protein
MQRIIIIKYNEHSFGLTHEQAIQINLDLTGKSYFHDICELMYDFYLSSRKKYSVKVTRNEYIYLKKYM